MKFRWIGMTSIVALLTLLTVIFVRAKPSSQEGSDGMATHEWNIKGEQIEVSEESADRIGLEVFKLIPRDEPLILCLTGRTGLNMEHVFHVHAQFPGRIVEIGPQLGSRVQGPGSAGRKPTILCTIESVDLANTKSDYLKAKVQLALDEDALRRTQELVQTKIEGEKYLLDAKSAVIKDQADLEATRQRLLVFGLTDSDLQAIEKQQGRQRMLYSIQSPSSGTVIEKNVTQGEVADPSVNLFTIADTSTLWVWGDVYERDWSRVRVGQKMRVILAAYPDLRLETRIDFISPALDNSTRSIRIRGMIDNRSLRLLSDMYGTLDVTVDEGRNSLVIPTDAVVRKSQSEYVFVQKDRSTDGKGIWYERRPVLTQIVDADHLRVFQGLSAGETIVRRGALQLFEEMEAR